MHELARDVVVIGGGPAGLAAAASAAETGRSVVIVDDNPDLGGQVWRHDVASGKSRVAAEWLALVENLGVTRLCGTTIVDANERTLMASSGGESLTIRGSTIVIATGAAELFLPFPGWTMPGVVGAGGIQSLVKSGLDVRGKRVVVAGSGPLLLAVASFLSASGAKVLAVVEQAPRSRVMSFGMSLVRHPRKGAQAIELMRSLAGVPMIHEGWVTRAEGAGSLERVIVRTDRGERGFDCDFLASGYGLVPETRVAGLLGCEISSGRVRVDEIQRTSQDGVFCAGESTGVGGVDVALVEGRVAGYAAAGKEESARALFAIRNREWSFAKRLNETYSLRAEVLSLADDETILCRCEDVSLGSVRRFDTMRDAKLQTRCGMGPCQARVCGPAARMILGWEGDRVRPPLFPVEMERLSGSN